MYAFLEGLVEEKRGNEVILNVSGMGYQILCTQSTLASTPPKGEFVRINTWLNVREDAMELFGFASREERSMFLNLTTVTGIGPRTAMNILGSMPLKDLTLAILTEDTASLSRAPGVGKKTALRIALELKDKLSPDEAYEGLGTIAASSSAAQGGVTQEAILALQSLGYSQSEASLAVAKAASEGDSQQADDLVRKALRSMMKG